MANFRLPGPETFTTRASHPTRASHLTISALQAAAAGLTDEDPQDLAGTADTAALEAALAATTGGVGAVITHSYVAAIRLLLSALASGGQTIRLVDDVAQPVAAVLADMAASGQVRWQNPCDAGDAALVIHSSMPATVSELQAGVHVLLADAALLSELSIRDLPFALIVADLSGLDGSTDHGGVILDTGRYDWVGHACCEREVRGGEQISFADEHGRLAMLMRLRQHDRPRQGVAMADSVARHFLQAMPQRRSADRQRANTVLQLEDQIRSLKALPCVLLAREPHQASLTLRFGDDADAIVFVERLKLIPLSRGICRDVTTVNVPGLTDDRFFGATAMYETTGSVVLSIGLEDPQDLLDDLQQAVKALQKRKENAS